MSEEWEGEEEGGLAIQIREKNSSRSVSKRDWRRGEGVEVLGTSRVFWRIYRML